MYVIPNIVVKYGQVPNLTNITYLHKNLGLCQLLFI